MAFLLVADVPGAFRHEDEVAVAILGHVGAIIGDQILDRRLVPADPARGIEGRGFKPRRDLIFRLQSGDQHFELELSHDADDPLAADFGVENLDDALFGQVVQCLAQLLGLGRVLERDAAQDFGREIGEAGEAQAGFFGQRVAHAQRPMIGDTDNVARKGLVGQFAVLREEEDRRMNGERLARAGWRQLHAAAELARNETHEGDAVAVHRVHVRLHLEDEARHFALVGLDGGGFGGLGTRRRGVLAERVDQFGDAEELERRSEIDRGQVARTIAVEVEFGIAALRQFSVLAQSFERLFREEFAKLRIVEAGDMHLLAFELARRAARLAQAVGGKVVDAFELATHAGGPAHGTNVKLQLVGDLVQKAEDFAALAIDLVDEGDDGDVAQAADLEQLARLRLDALGRVDHHDGGIHRGQRAIGILAEILVPRRVEQVEGDGFPVARPLERHDRGGDGDAALLLDLHPVGAGAAIGPARLDLTGKVDRPPFQQQLFSERGLARVRVRDDGEGAARGDGHIRSRQTTAVRAE